MKVLVACEESQRVCIAFRGRGHKAYSCDILDCSGGHPEWHIKDDVRNVLKHELTDPIYDLVVGHPPCTFLTCSGNKWFKPEYKERFPDREDRREEAIKFFMFFTFLKTPRVVIENPIGIMSTVYQKPTQIIQPYQFGHPNRKSTCLWLKGLPKLSPTKIVEPKIHVCKSGKTMDYDYMYAISKEDRSKIRSKTFLGIAQAMAEQWG